MKELSRFFWLTAALCSVLLNGFSPAQANGEGDSLSLAQRLARQHIERFPEPWLMRKSDGAYRWSYTPGLVLLGMERLHEVDNNVAWLDYIQAYADHYIGEDGVIQTYSVTDFNIDSLKAGDILFGLHERTGDPRYRAALDSLRLQLQWHPRTQSGGFWHKRKYPWQVWLDGLYMGQPFYARYERTFGSNPGAFDDIVGQFSSIEQKTRDPETGLLRHGWDESALQRWADPVTGLSPGYWSRAMGWYAMALVDVVEYLPDGHAGHAALGGILARMAAMLETYQDETGLWWQVPEQGGREGNWLEASGSAMFVYALAKGVRLGLLDPQYLDIARKGEAGLLAQIVTVDPDGSVHVEDICRSAGLGGEPYRDGSYAYYMSTDRVRDDAHGIGAFLLAAAEMARAD